MSYTYVCFRPVSSPTSFQVLDEKALASQRIGKPTLKGSAAQRGLCSAKNIFDIVDADQAVSIRVSKGSTEAQCVVTKIAERVYRYMQRCLNVRISKSLKSNVYINDIS